MSTTPASWFRDPVGRFDERYWDGSQWTARIRTGGNEGVDPMGAHYTAPVTPTVNPPVPPPAVGPQSYPYGAYGMAPVPKVAGLAIASMVLGIVWIYWVGSVLALIFGFIALSQIKRSNGWKTGRGMAIAGVVLGFVGLATFVLVIVFAIANANNDSGSRINTDPYDGYCNESRYLQDPDC